jgi:predicted extracellular nuclease
MKNLVPVLFVVFSLFACGQKTSTNENSDYKHASEISRVVFYNVENLFDTINDPTTKDEEYLPNSDNKWDAKKYQRKLKSIAKVISSICDSVKPLAVGLCEIENKQVLEDLIAQPALLKYNFGIAHLSSEDERGIETALLYNRNLIKEVLAEKLSVNLGSDKTRDILHFKGIVGDGYSLSFFVNHWPSRGGGEQESEVKRLVASATLRDKLEDLYAEDPTARVVIMGDFNDNPDNKSIVKLTSGKVKIPEQQTLVNLTKPLFDKGGFTLKYMGESDVFDQIIVSKNLLNSKSKYFVTKSGAKIFAANWLLYKHAKYGLIPNRTYASGKYVGGYSDHLPVYFDIVFK